MTDYKSSPLTAELIKWADLVLVMEFNHKKKAIDMVPEASEKVFCLGGFNKEMSSLFIPDPIKKPLPFYFNTYNYIKQSIEDLMLWLKE